MYKNDHHWESMLDYSAEELKDHLENLFEQH
jgi:hypothetical protein